MRRRGLVVLAALALVAVPVGFGSPPAPASAARRIAVGAVGGDRQVSAAWSAVAGARGYVVHWGSGTATDHARTTSATSIRITGVADRRVYSLRVTAIGVAASSPRVSARAVPYVPTSLTAVHAVSAGPNRIRVSWSGGTQARSVAVIAGADSMMTVHRFSTRWMPAAVRGVTITVPPSLRGVLGAGTGNVVFVKVALTNSPAADPVQGLRFSLADRYRISPSGTWALAGAALPGGPSTRLSVASWNVQSVSASERFSEQDRWARRLPRVVANIEDAHPDLIGLQELTSARIDPDCLNPPAAYPCQEQYQTLQDALGSAPVQYRNARTDANAWVYQQHGPAYVDSALFYDPTRLTVQASGFVSPRTIMGSAWPASLTDEAGMWARFSTVGDAGGPAREFVAVSLHLPAGDHAALRAAEAAAVAAFVEEQAAQPDGTTLPVVFTGDFNDNGATAAQAGSLRLIARGYVDTAATADRTGLRYSTSNGTNGTDGADPGYPVHAVAHPYPTSRIDYVMIKDSPHLFGYRDLVRLGAGGVFDPRFQGSDHNMQLAAVGIGDPVRAR